MPHITKIGLAVVRDNRLLLVRKRGAPSWILPGGKPEPTDKDEIGTLVREIREELGCGIRGWIVRRGEYTNKAADLEDTTVTVVVYTGDLTGEPTPQSEIEALWWFNPEVDHMDALAPSLRYQILPALFPYWFSPDGSWRRLFIDCI